MDTKATTQAGQIAPAAQKLTLEAGAFNAQLTSTVGTKKFGWTTDEHIKFVEGIIPKLTDQKGMAPTLTKEHWNSLQLIFRPTEDAQRAVLRQTFAAAGYILDSEADKALTLLLSAPQFAETLANTVNPATGQPFIQKEKKRGVKKSTLASLISAPTTVAEPASPQAAGAPTTTETTVAKTETTPTADGDAKQAPGS